MLKEKLHHVIHNWDRILVKFFDNDLPESLGKIEYKKTRSVAGIVLFVALSGGVEMNPVSGLFQFGPVTLGIDGKNILTADYTGICLPDNSPPTSGDPEFRYNKYDGSQERRMVRMPFGNIYKRTDTGLYDRRCSTSPLSRRISIPQ